jgi:hypothetical protein
LLDASLGFWILPGCGAMVPCFGLRRAPRSSSRCRCLSSGPRGGRRLGGGGCRCLSSGPRGGRCPGGGDALGGCRCLSGGPRGGRRLGGGCRCLLVGPRGGRWAGAGVGPGSRSVARCVAWLRGAPKSAGGAAVCAVVPRVAPVVLRGALVGPRLAPMPPNPVRVRLAAPPRGVGLSVPWSASPRPRGGLVCRAWESPPVLFRRRAVVGPGGRAAGGVASPKRGGGAGCLGVSAPPRGVGLTSAPGGAAGCLGQAPSGPFCRRASSFRRRASACIAGVISSRLERPPGCSAEAARSGSAAGRAGPKLRRRCLGSASAAPGPKLRRGVCGGPSVGGPRPRGGLGYPVRRASLFHPARGLAGAPALPKRCRCRHDVPLFGRARGPVRSLPCRSVAGPTRPSPPR